MGSYKHGKPDEEMDVEELRRAIEKGSFTSFSAQVLRGCFVLDWRQENRTPPGQEGRCPTERRRLTRDDPSLQAWRKRRRNSSAFILVRDPADPSTMEADKTRTTVVAFLHVDGLENHQETMAKENAALDEVQ